jgi:hypothetical protein
MPGACPIYRADAERLLYCRWDNTRSLIVSHHSETLRLPKLKQQHQPAGQRQDKPEVAAEALMRGAWAVTGSYTGPSSSGNAQDSIHISLPPRLVMQRLQTALQKRRRKKLAPGPHSNAGVDACTLAFICCCDALECTSDLVTLYLPAGKGGSRQLPGEPGHTPAAGAVPQPPAPQQKQQAPDQGHQPALQPLVQQDQGHHTPWQGPRVHLGAAPPPPLPVPTQGKPASTKRAAAPPTNTELAQRLVARLRAESQGSLKDAGHYLPWEQGNKVAWKHDQLVTSVW